MSSSDPIDTSRKRFRINVLANFAYFVLNAGIQLWFVRYLIDNLGIATYGLVPLATNVTNFMAILTIALSGSVGRFLTIDIARGDVTAGNRTFNTSLFASIALALGLVPLVVAFAWFAPALLNIPIGEEMGARFLLMCTGFAFLLNAVGSNFACSTFAKNRFDVQRLVDALGFLTQVGVILALFTLVEGNLWCVGIGIAASAVVRQAGYQISWRRLTPELHIRFSDFDRTRLKKILGMGGWLVVNQAGAEIFLHFDLLIVNAMVSAHAAGLYAPGLQIAFALRTMAGMVTGVLRPTYVASYARGETERLVRISQRIVKLLGLAMAIPIGLVCGLSKPLLGLWLGEDFRAVAPLLMILIIHLTVNIAVMPLFGINHAMNRIKWPGIVSVATGLANVLLAVVLAGPAGWGSYGVATAGAIALTAKNAFYTPIYAAHILNRPLFTFARALGPGVVATGLITVAARGLAHFCKVQSYFGTAVLAAAVTIVAGVLIYFLALSPGDRASILKRSNIGDSK